MIFESKVNGIPCKVRVTGYVPYVPMRITGSGFGDADPPEGGEAEFELLDRRGRPAAWLEPYRTPEVEERLMGELHVIITAVKHGIDY